MTKNEQLFRESTLLGSEVFRIYITLPNGDVHMDTDYTSSMDEIHSALQRLMKGPGRVVVKEIKVTDGDDFVCMHIVEGRLVYPTKEMVESVTGEHYDP